MYIMNDNFEDWICLLLVAEMTNCWAFRREVCDQSPNLHIRFRVLKHPLILEFLDNIIPSSRESSICMCDILLTLMFPRVSKI